MLIRLAFLCILQLALSGNVFGQDIITNCDKYAASKLDSQGKDTGIPIDQLNPVLAVPACEAAIRQYPNSPRLIFQLGRAYYKANNFAAALVQYRKAADQNYAAAQYGLGVMYAHGEGVPKDDQQAVVWYRKAADQNLAAAQNNLGLMYENGRGVPPDAQQAAAWFRKAADQGDVTAKDNLADLAALNASGQATSVPQTEKLDLRVEKYVGLQSKDGLYDGEAIRITNLGRSPIAIYGVTFNDGSRCSIGNFNAMLRMGDFETYWPCSGSIIEVQIKTDRGTVGYSWR
jgi:TPR repeat protein